MPFKEPNKKYLCEFCGKFITRERKSKHLKICSWKKDKPNDLKDNPNALKDKPNDLKDNPNALKDKPNASGGDLLYSGGDLLYSGGDLLYSGGDLQSSKITSALLKPFTWEKYPGERHLFKHNYTGPGTRLDLRLDPEILDSEGKPYQPLPGEEPINRVDQSALKHDLAYQASMENEDNQLRDRHLADINLIHDLNNIENPTLAEKMQRTLVKLAMKAKIVFGGKLKNHTLSNLPTTKSSNNLPTNTLANKNTLDNKNTLATNNTLSNNNTLANELHKPFYKSKHYLKVFIPESNNTWACDLIDFTKLPSSCQNKYILVCIDLFSRYCYYAFLKNKSTQALIQAYEEIFDSNIDKVPKYLWWDKERGIISKYFKNYALKNKMIVYHTTMTNHGSVFAERFIRTFKNKLWKHFTIHQGNQKWDTKIVSKIILDYNNLSIHSSIGTTPYQAMTTKTIYLNLPNQNPINLNPKNLNQKPKPKKAKFKIGDYVRIVKYKLPKAEQDSNFKKRGSETFRKGYIAKWTHEIFVVTKIQKIQSLNIYNIKPLSKANNQDILTLRFYEKNFSVQPCFSTTLF